MTDFTVLKCDSKTDHNPGYFHEQSKNRDWLIMCFQTPFLYYKDGKMIEGKTGECIINSPGKYIKHGPTDFMEKGFQNDWMYIGHKDAEKLFNELHLPVDTHFSLENPDFMTKTIQNIMYEEHNQCLLYKEKISCMVWNLLLDMSRCLHGNSKYSSKGDIFDKLRNRIFNSVEDCWTLDKMADSAGYSVSRFSYLYKKKFNISPLNDLILMRVQKAKNFLSYSDFTVSETAVKCGFSSVQYFSCTFKKIVGVTPSEYKEKNSFFCG